MLYYGSTNCELKRGYMPMIKSAALFEKIKYSAIIGLNNNNNKVNLYTAPKSKKSLGAAT